MLYSDAGYLRRQWFMYLKTVLISQANFFYKENKRVGKGFGIQGKRLIRHKLQAGDFSRVSSFGDQSFFIWVLGSGQFPWNTMAQIPS